MLRTTILFVRIIIKNLRKELKILEFSGIKILRNKHRLFLEVFETQTRIKRSLRLLKFLIQISKLRKLSNKFNSKVELNFSF